MVLKFRVGQNCRDFRKLESIWGKVKPDLINFLLFSNACAPFLKKSVLKQLYLRHLVSYRR